MSKPQIAILGSGPTGLEAALAAADFGYPFTVFEASSTVAGHVRSWGHVRLFSPWAYDVSPRMRTHLEAAGHHLPAPDDASCPTGNELIERILAPVSKLPAVGPHLQLLTRVIEISRQGLLKHEEIGTGKRGEHRFRISLRRRDGTELIHEADVVLDCTGTYSNPSPLGDGGIAAPGERGLADRIRRDIPEFLREPDEWAGKTILLVGAGHSAQTAASDLADFAKKHPGTKIVWALRRQKPRWQADDDDPLPERAHLVRRAAGLVAAKSPAVEAVPGVVIDSLARRNGEVVATLRHGDGSTRSLEVDRVLALTGSVGDHSIYRQLQVHECWATSGPMKLASALLGSESTDCLSQESYGAETLVNPEPGFFILGAKSYGRNTTFLMRVGWQQVEEIFTLLESA